MFSIDLSRYVAGNATSGDARRDMLALKSMYGSHDIFSLFGAPSNADHFSGEELQHVSGWNWTAILAKSLQWVLADVSVYIPPHIAELANYTPQIRKSLDTRAKQNKNIPEDWVIAPPGHIIAKLLSNPNPWVGRESLLFEISQQLECHGVAYVILLPDDRDRPKHMYLIPRGLIWDVGGTSLHPEGAYQTGQLLARPVTYNPEKSGSPQTMRQMYQWLSNKEFSARYVMQLSYPSLLYRDQWTSPTRMMADTNVTERQLRDSRWATLQKQTSNGPVFKEKPGVTLSPAQKEHILAEHEAKAQGPQNSGAPRWAQDGVEVEMPGYSAREMEYADSTEQNRKELLGQRMTPESVVGLSGSGNYAETIGIVRTWSRFASQPVMDLVTGQMECHLRTFFEYPFDEFSIHMLAGTIDDDQLRQQQLMNEVTATSITIGEFREASGRERFGDERDEKIAGQLLPTQEAPPEILPGRMTAPGTAPAATAQEPPRDNEDGVPQPRTAEPPKEAAGEQTTAPFTKALVQLMETPPPATLRPEITPFVMPTRSGMPYFICDLPEVLAEKVRWWRQQIRTVVPAAEWLEEPHLTLHGPVNGSNQRGIDAAVAWLRTSSAIHITVAKALVFPGASYDVLAVSVDSSILEPMRKELDSYITSLSVAKLPYRPHITIAYGPKGAFAGSAGEPLPGLTGMFAAITQIRLSGGSQEIVIPLSQDAGTVAITGDPNAGPNIVTPLDDPPGLPPVITATPDLAKDMKSWDSHTGVLPVTGDKPEPTVTLLPERESKPEPVDTTTPSAEYDSDDDTSRDDEHDDGWDRRIEDVLTQWFGEET